MRPSTREQIGGGLRLVVVEAESPEAARCRRTAPETPSLAGANRAPSLIRARRGRAKACPEGRLNVIAGYTTTHAGPLADVFEPRCWRLRALANHPPVHACPNWGLFAVSSALQSPMRFPVAHEKNHQRSFTLLLSRSDILFEVRCVLT